MKWRSNAAGMIAAAKTVARSGYGRGGQFARSLIKQGFGLLGYEIRSIQPAALPPLLIETAPIEYELLRSFATRAAENFVSPAQTRAIQDLHLTRILQPERPTAHTRISIGNANTSRVGIWRREGLGKDAAFVRSPAAKADWFFWADKDRIEPKRSKWRVALLGESVARGYLYDPQYNFAKVLQGMLQSSLGAANIDVVDLAKSNLGMDQLKTLFGECLALRPDVIVIFAGNNWRPQLTEADIPCVDTLLRHGGAPEMKAFLDLRAKQAVQLLGRQVNDVLDRYKNLPVIWVIPEFNLEDWADPVSNAPCMPANDARQWRELDACVVAALHDGDLALAEGLARKMVELDGETSSVSLRVLAQCRRAGHDLGQTRRYLEMARDAEGWDPAFAYSPRTSISIQDSLRALDSDPRNIVVDLPAIFEQYLDHALPNRRIFLDYCHLTAEGMTLTAASVASRVLAALGDNTIAPGDFQNKSQPPPAVIEGKASFLAAVHNAHFHQELEIVQYWCKRALDFWPGCAELMMRFVDAQARRGPVWACRSTAELFELDQVGALNYLLRSGGKNLNLVLGEAVTKAVASVGRTVPTDLLELWTSEHSVGAAPKQLTDLVYSSAIPSRWKRSWTSCSLQTNRGSLAMFASAFWETSTFILFAEQGRPIGVKLTYRLPTCTVGEGAIEVAVNGLPVGRAPADRTWKTLAFSVPGDCVVNGLNELVIAWPDCANGSDEVLNKMADAVLEGKLPRFHTVFGEIHSLLVVDAADNSWHGAHVDTAAPPPTTGAAPQAAQKEDDNPLQ
jgi:hypothetical protein